MTQYNKETLNKELDIYFEMLREIIHQGSIENWASITTLEKLYGTVVVLMDYKVKPTKEELERLRQMLRPAKDYN